MPNFPSYKATERMGETFSYLPLMTPEEIRQQIEYCIAQGWNPALEHTEPEKSFSNFWYLWKLPFFGETSVDRVLAEVEECRRINPDHLIRLIAYDNYAQSQGMAFIVHRGGVR